MKKLALMICYRWASQLTLEGFTPPFNRWVILAELILWDDLASIYASKFGQVIGRRTDGNWSANSKTLTTAK